MFDNGLGLWYYVDMKKIKLYGNKNKEALIDDEDFEKINKHKWYAKKCKNTYYVTSTSHKEGCSKIDKDRNINTVMHRLILGLIKDDNKYVDHIDGNGLNNQKSNLRVCTNKQNCWNRRNYKGYLGVSKDRCLGFWRTRVGSTTYGQYRDSKIAAMVYDKVVRSLRGGFASLNFPNESLPNNFEIVNFNTNPRIATMQSGIVGIVWHKTKKMWRVLIKGKTYGYFKDIEDAKKRKEEICKSNL